MRVPFRPCVAALAAALWLALPSPAQALDLATAMEAAAGRNEQARAALLRLESAERGQVVARGGFLPNATFSGSLIRNDTEIAVGDRNFTNLYDYAGRLQVQVPLVNLTQFAVRDTANAQFDQADATATLRQADLRLATGRAYVAALAAEQTLAAAAERVNLARASLEQVQVLLDGGFEIAATLAQVELQVQQALSDEIRARLDRDNARSNLAFLMGDDMDALQQEPLMDVELPALPTTPSRLLATEAVAATAVEIAHAALRSSRFAWAPTLDLVGQYNLGRPSLRAPNGTFWTVTLALNWAFLDPGRQARIEGAAAIEDAASLEQQLVERNVLQQRGLAERALLAAEASLQATLAQVEVAIRNEELQRDRFTAGDATALELTQAQTALFEARSALALAELQCHLSHLDQLYLAGALDAPLVSVNSDGDPP